MSDGMHRCCVDGCPNVASFEVRIYEFDPTEGALSLLEDETCPFICVEHAIDNERGASGSRRPWTPTTYPHTNRAGRHGICVYAQLEPAYIA